MQASLGARIQVVPPCLAQGQNSQYKLMSSCCTEFQIPHPQPLSIKMDVNTTSSEFTVTSGHDTVPETSGISSQSESPPGVPLSRAWPPAPPPKAVTVLGHHLGRARPHSPCTESVYVERARSEAAPVVQETPPDGATTGAASRVMPPPLLHSLRHGWGQFAHSNTLF